jgi:hypothetical protein
MNVHWMRKRLLKEHAAAEFLTSIQIVMEWLTASIRVPSISTRLQVQDSVAVDFPTLTLIMMALWTARISVHSIH